MSKQIFKRPSFVGTSKMNGRTVRSLIVFTLSDCGRGAKYKLCARWNAELRLLFWRKTGFWGLPLTKCWEYEKNIGFRTVLNVKRNTIETQNFDSSCQVSDRCKKMNKVVLLICVALFCLKSALGQTCGYASCPATKDGMINVHLVPHTHDDVGWLKTVDQYYYGSRKVMVQINWCFIFAFRDVSFSCSQNWREI